MFDEARKVKVAVIGAGVSGLVAAYELRDQSVTVFEKQDRIGGHAYTIDMPTDGKGRRPRVDIGFMVFNDTNYPAFARLLKELGVESRATKMSFSVSDAADVEFASHSVNGLFANRRNVMNRHFIRMIAEYVRFNAAGKRLLASRQDPSFLEWLRSQRFSRFFTENLIIPQICAVWSTDRRQVDAFPARFILQFFENHGMLRLSRRPKWRTVRGGSRSYVDAVASRIGTVRLSAQVENVERKNGAIRVVTTDGAVELFDRAILACHSDEALRVLNEPSAAEVEVLSAIHYSESVLTLHCDESILPRRHAAQAHWNYHLARGNAEGPTVTYDLRGLQRIDYDRAILASLNMGQVIDPSQVVGEFRFAHPIFDQKAAEAQLRHPEIDGVDRLHFAGAYWGWGFHEDGVSSGIEAAYSVRRATGNLVGV